MSPPIDDAQRGVCTRPTGGLDDPASQEVLAARLKRILAIERPDLQRQLLSDLQEDFRSHAGSPRVLLERRRWASEEERLLYVRYMVEVELGAELAQVQPFSPFVSRDPEPPRIEKRNAPSAARVLVAMVDYETNRLRSLADEMVPVPPQSCSASQFSLGALDPRGTSNEWDRRAAEDTLVEYEAFLLEVELAEEEQRRAEHLEGCARLRWPGSDCPPRASSSPATVDVYQQYVGGAVESGIAWGREEGPELVSLGMDFIPVVGSIKAALEAVIGVDIITGRELPAWERGLNALLALIPEAKGIFKAGRMGLRRLARVTVKGRRSAREVYRVAKGAVTVSEAEVLAAKEVVNGKAAHPTQFEKVAGTLEDMVGNKPKGANAKSYRVASGLIEDGRGLSRSSASSATKVGAPPPGRPPIVAKATAPGVLAQLTKAGISADAVRALEQAGVNVTEDLAKTLATTRAGTFVNMFHTCSGFEHVVKDLAVGSSKKKGALFVIDFVTDRLNGINPKLARFELPVGITKGVRADTVARFTDLVILDGTRTISFEFKAYGRSAVIATLENSKKVLQLVKDVAMLGRRNIRWVFDSSEVTRELVYKKMKEAIKGDALLAREFGEGAKLEQALDEMVIMYPSVVKLPAGAVPLGGVAQPLRDDDSKKR